MASRLAGWADGRLRESRTGREVSILSDTDVVIFDMDGVLWTGDYVIEGIPEAITALQAAGKKVLFMTNNSSKHRSEYVTKRGRMGYHGIKDSQIYTSAYATALYLAKARDEGRWVGGKVFCCTGPGFCRELEELGIDSISGTDFAKAHVGMSVNDVTELALEDGVGAVVTGFNYHLYV